MDGDGPGPVISIPVGFSGGFPIWQPIKDQRQVWTSEFVILDTVRNGTSCSEAALSPSLVEMNPS